jgi:hypothetical protein
LETTDDNSSESTEVCKCPPESEAKLTVTQLPDDCFLQRKLRSKRKRDRFPDPDYVDIAESPEAKLRKKSRDLASERGKTTKLKKANGVLLDKIKKLEAKVQQEQRQRKENFKQYVQKLKAAPVVAEDECALRQSLKNLGQTCARWAERYAAAPGSDDVNLEQRQNVLEGLKGYQAVSLEGQELIFLQQKSREILLNATLTHLVYLEILARPFYFFQHAVDAGGPKELEASLTWLHKFTSAG